MSIDAVSAYASTASTDSTAATASSKKSSLSMDDFLQLMVAQLQNQDMNNAADTSQFTSQMAQYSMVQALSDMSKQSATSYSVSLIGKDVTLVQTTTTGVKNIISGKVDGVSLYNGETKIIVNGNSYDMSDIITVSQATTAK